MEGIYIVIAIIIALFNITAKQKKKNQSGSKGGTNRKPVQRQKYIPQWSEGPLSDLGKSWNELFGSQGEHVPESKHAEDYEGMEIEDRRRTGSLDYVELSQSSEGICDEHPEQHNRQDALKAEISGTEEEDYVFEITEDILLKSIIMAEVLGPPRAMKRNIR